MNTNTRKLTESALMVALATVLCLIPPIYTMPRGGSVTWFSCVPIILIAYRHGVKWGLASGLTFGLIQLLAGGLVYLQGIDLTGTVFSIIADFLITFTILGLSGLFRKAIKNQPIALGVGTSIAFALRFINHFLVGMVVYAPLFNEEAISNAMFSFLYNITYLAPELLVTLIGATAVILTVDLTGPKLTRR